MPQTRAKVTFEGEWAQTLNGQPFLLVEDGEKDKIIIFSTIENLHTHAAATDFSTLMEHFIHALNYSTRSSQFMQ